MAYNDSGELPVSQSTYSLGGYTFKLKVQNVHEPGEPDVVSVFAICRGPDGTRETQAVDYPASTTVESWSVECNETEASVYAHINTHTPRCIGPTATAGQVFASGYYFSSARVWTCTRADEPVLAGVCKIEQGNWIQPTLVGTVSSNVQGMWNGYRLGVSARATINGVDFVLVQGGSIHTYEGEISGTQLGTFTDNDAAINALVRQYFKFDSDDEATLVARFAIDLHEADPEDWDEPGDTGEPSKTLHVNVIGASPGNAEGTPLEAEAAMVYGSGGTGGNGGSGGAGASTVIIYDFTTDKAGNVEQEAYTRGYGIGGSGGKGGRGGDGCILIFY